MRSPKEAGLTLVELMVVVAIIGLLAGIALPLYNNYITTSREGALVSSISTIRVFQEDYRIREGTYAGGTYDGGADAALAVLGWDPRENDVVYVVVANADIDYRVTATDNAGTSVCRVYPAGDPCP